jgi:hypothetical protein
MGFFDGLESQTTNPLFLGGAALLSGEGMSGAMRGMQMGSQFAQQRKQQLEDEQKKQLWQQYTQSPGFGAGLPAGAIELMRVAGPQAGISLAASLYGKSADRDIERMRLAQTQKYQDAQIGNMEAQRRLQEEDVKRRSATADFELGIMRQLMPGGGAAAPVVPQGDPNIRPQSFEGGASGVPGLVTDQDPNFIRTQATDAPTQSVPADGMIQTPYGPKTPEEARRLAGAMMLSPKFAQAGKAIMESIPQTKLGREVGNELDKKQLNTQESLARLNTISSTFKPEFQTIEDRLGYAWTEFASKFRAGQAVVTPDQERSLAEFSAFRADAINNLNQYIKEITGAAMTNAEAARIMRAMPNPGEGIFDGDSPVQFKSKLDAAVYNSKLAIARYNYMRANGFTGNADEAARKMTLDSVPDVMNRRGRELRDQVQKSNPGVRPENLRPLVEQQLRKEFGINI